MVTVVLDDIRQGKLFGHTCCDVGNLIDHLSNYTMLENPNYTCTKKDANRYAAGEQYYKRYP